MATTQTERRTLRFGLLEEVICDAEQLAERPHRTTGKWTYGQILSHLAKGADACFDGFGNFLAPWWARWFIAPLVKRRFINGPMRAGIQVPLSKTTLMPEPDISVDDGLAHLRRAMARFDAEMPGQPHPFIGKLRSRDEYVALMLRHCELHMSFVHPAE